MTDAINELAALLKEAGAKVTLYGKPIEADDLASAAEASADARGFRAALDRVTAGMEGATVNVNERDSYRTRGAEIERLTAELAQLRARLARVEALAREWRHITESHPPHIVGPEFAICADELAAALKGEP